MLPLPSAEWYRDHPKPLNSQNNYDIPMFHEGLRIPVADYESLVSELTTAMEHSSIPFDNPTWNLRSPENRSSISSVLQRLIDKNSAKYGWHEINNKIIRDYLFEFFKRWLFNKKRSLLMRSAVNLVSRHSVPVTPTKLSALQSSLQASQPLAPRHQLSSGPTFPSAPSLSLQCPQGPATPAASSLSSTPLLHQNASQVHPLHTCTVLVRRLDNGEDYEDTIEVFQKAASENLGRDYRPNDYDFLLFKKELAEVLSYNDQTDIIRYHHFEKGPVDVSHDSKWRVALRYLASQTSSGVLNFEIAQKGKPSGLRHAPTANEGVQLMETSPIHPSPSSPSSATQQEAAPATETILANSLAEKSTPSTREVAAQTARPSVDTPVSISSDSDAQKKTTLDDLWANDESLSSSLDSDTYEPVARTPVSLSDDPWTTSSTGNRQQEAVRTTQLGRGDHPNSQSPRKRYAKTPSSAPISRRNTITDLNLLDHARGDEEESSDSDVPVKRRRTQRSLNMATTPRNQQLPQKLTMRSTADNIWVANWKLVLSYGTKADPWHLNYKGVAFKDGKAKENWKTFEDTRSLVTFSDWMVEKIDRPGMCRLGFFCTWSEGWVGKPVKAWKMEAQWHAWGAALRPVSGQKQGKELIIWDSNCLRTHPAPGPVYLVRLLGMQRNLVDFVSKQCRLVQVWVGGSSNGGKGKCMSLTQGWLHQVCKDYPGSFHQEQLSWSSAASGRWFEVVLRKRVPHQGAALPNRQLQLQSSRICRARDC